MFVFVIQHVVLYVWLLSVALFILESSFNSSSISFYDWVIVPCRDIILPAKVCLVKALVFPVVMYGCEIWAIKKPKCWRIDVFELWCWKRLLRVPWTVKGSNQSTLKEINSEYSLEGLMLKLKPQSFGYLMQRTSSFEKTLMLGKIEGRKRRDDRRWDVWMASLTALTWVWSSSRSWFWTGKPGGLQSMGSQVVGHTECLNWLSDWMLSASNCKASGPITLWEIDGKQ